MGLRLPPAKRVRFIRHDPPPRLPHAPRRRPLHRRGRALCPSRRRAPHGGRPPAGAGGGRGARGGDLRPRGAFGSAAHGGHRGARPRGPRARSGDPGGAARDPRGRPRRGGPRPFRDDVPPGPPPAGLPRGPVPGRRDLGFAPGPRAALLPRPARRCRLASSPGRRARRGEPRDPARRPRRRPLFPRPHRAGPGRPEHPRRGRGRPRGGPPRQPHRLRRRKGRPARDHDGAALQGPRARTGVGRSAGRRNRIGVVHVTIAEADMRGNARVLSWLFSLTATGAATLAAQPFPRPDIPPELRPWVPWVLDGAKDHVCTAVEGNAVCLWPGRLRLDLAAGGGSFRQELLADRDVDAPLPGDEKHWPQGVTLDGRPAPVFARGAVPTIRLSAGSHAVDGRFDWRHLPDSLRVPARTALVDLRVEGAAVSLPARDQDGLLWLRREGMQATATAESLRVQAFRRIRDGQPIFIDTVLLLEVSGKAREIELRGALLEGSLPVSVAGGLPAQIDKSGRLRLQVRSGRFTVETQARVEGRPGALAAPKAPEPWPDHEGWGFAADELLRQVAVTGGTPVDPARTDLPEGWRALPAFFMAPGASLILTEVRRGEPEAAPDKLRLGRELWLDLDGRALTARDTWSGDLNRTWRLDVAPSAELGRVAVDGRDQLVTSNPTGGAPGVELRRGALNMVADSRFPRSLGLPAVGWSVGREQLQGTLFLPPGWRLLGATGVDSLPGAWVSRWTLLGFFFVLLVGFGVQRLLGWRAAVTALLAVGLSYHEPGTPFLAWLSLLGACALLQAAPAGRLGTVGRAWWWASLVVLGLVLVPFFKDQVKVALFPQVEDRAPSRAAGKADFGTLGYVSGGVAPAMAPPRAAAPAAPATNASQVAEEVEDKAEQMQMTKEGMERQMGALSAPRRAPYRARDNYAQKNSALEQDPHAVVQTGPGVPTSS